ncbi:hypothetical protein [Labrys wisconsinensis]|uniref:Transcriptional regulator n=1 Tax=Labrys wisconsinensis TaxID=425677 RepID=A0ABU0JEU5_9HYPH|nr:hypothetical protein [Labrys wisconsinensis]MDQ0472791.1 hypothetical protein [Labrys wisconsinensis]
MDNPLLPTGMTGLIKAATRDLVLAAGGPARVKEILKVSDGQISKWQGDDYPDLMPTWAVAKLSYVKQTPAFARFLAALVNHEVVPVPPDDEGESDLMGDLVGVTRDAAQVTSALGEALSPASPGGSSVTPCEAKGTLSKIGRLERRLDGTKLRLAAVAGRRA